MNNDEKKEIILKPITGLSFKYPEKPETLNNKEHNDIINNLNKNVCITPKNEVAVKKQGILKILLTDKKGANKFINDLPNDQRIENGNDIYAKLPSVQKEISKRIQEPRDSLVIEKLKDTEKSLIAIRDNPKLERERSVCHQRIENELPKLKNKKIKAENITADDITGEPLRPDAVAHHVERKADDPNNALNLSNIAILNQDIHIEGHQNNFEGKENYEKFKQKKNYEKNYR
jgi:hypothetical protein